MSKQSNGIRATFSRKEKSILWGALESHPLSTLLTDSEFDYVLDQIERSCNNAATEEANTQYIPAFWDYDSFCRIYMSICYRINTNLDTTTTVNNNYLGSSIINFMFKRRFESISPKKFMTMTGVRPEVYKNISAKISDMNTVDPLNVGYMSSEELYPGKNDSIHEEIELRRNQKIEHKTSSRYQCGKCKARKTRIEERQTRSLDEAATTFITCINCGNQWTKG